MKRNQYKPGEGEELTIETKVGLIIIIIIIIGGDLLKTMLIMMVQKLSIIDLDMVKTIEGVEMLGNDDKSMANMLLQRQETI